MDGLQRLRLAVAATRFGGRAAVATQVRRHGVQAVEKLLGSLPQGDRAYLERAAYELHENGVGAVLLGEPAYPTRLIPLRAAPPALFVRGRLALLSAPGIGVCGSRRTTAPGLRAARACAEVAADLGFTVTSGYAQGVDMESHAAALERGGRTIIALAEGITRFRVKPGGLGDVWDADRATVISQFAPDAPWHAGNAMARNAVIYGMGAGLVVVEAGEKGAPSTPGCGHSPPGARCSRWSSGPRRRRATGCSSPGAQPRSAAVPSSNGTSAS